jgi:hypothetical protein
MRPCSIWPASAFADATACFCASVAGVEAGEEGLRRLIGGHRVFHRQDFRIRLPASPKGVISFLARVPESIPRRLRLRPVLRQRLVEFQNLRRQRFERGLLPAEEREARADERSKDDRQKDGDEPGHLAHNTAGAVVYVLRRQALMNVEAEEGRSERYDEDQQRDEKNAHRNGPCALRALAEHRTSRTIGLMSSERLTMVSCLAHTPELSEAIL